MPPLKSIAIPVKKTAGHRRKGKAAAPETTVLAENHRPLQRVVAPPAHRYRVGERLQMANGGRTFSRVAATCVVVARLPYEGHGSLLYRVRSETEQYERVVAEMDLSQTQPSGLE
jgi:hypothetical protein